jgi:hypothetical protein
MSPQLALLMPLAVSTAALHVLPLLEKPTQFLPLFVAF